MHCDFFSEFVQNHRYQLTPGHQAFPLFLRWREVSGAPAEQCEEGPGQAHDVGEANYEVMDVKHPCLFYLILKKML